jgi:hypothetical protein
MVVVDVNLKQYCLSFHDINSLSLYRSQMEISSSSMEYAFLQFFSLIFFVFNPSDHIMKQVQVNYGILFIT